MNCFSFLSLPENHRSGNKIVQLVKHMHEVPAKKLQWPAYAQVKKDGVFCMLVVHRVHGHVLCRAFGRTGKKLSAMDPTCRWMEERVDARDMESGVYIGELCNSTISLEELSGIVNPNRTQPLSEEAALSHEDSGLYLHDHLYLHEFIDGVALRPYRTRYEHMQGMAAGYFPVLDLHVVQDPEHFEEYADRCIARGEEGAVLKQDCDWLAGHKGYRTVKKVRQVSYDLLCTGIEDGKGKREGIAANLFFQWRDGKTLKADLGKGWTDAQRAVLWDNRSDSLLGPVGQIYRVYGLQDSSKGVIRLPKVGEVRHDKNVPDY